MFLQLISNPDIKLDHHFVLQIPLENCMFLRELNSIPNSSWRKIPNATTVAQPTVTRTSVSSSQTMLPDRLKHFTWANFSMKMATASLSVVLYETPYQFSALKTLGKLIFMIDLLLLYPFYCPDKSPLHPRSLRVRSFSPTPVEAFFIGIFTKKLRWKYNDITNN